MIRVVRYRSTCGACPSQWEGTLDDGRALYVRYRNGRFRLAIARNMDDAIALAAGHPERWGAFLYERHVGELGDGYMTDAELREVTRGMVEWPAEVAPKWPPHFDEDGGLST